LQSLILAGKASALLDGRYNVSLDDIRQIARPALRHRIALNIRGETEGLDADGLVDEILAAIEK
jgi:MoxR-like ATPase